MKKSVKLLNQCAKHLTKCNVPFKFKKRLNVIEVRRFTLYIHPLNDTVMMDDIAHGRLYNIENVSAFKEFGW